MVAPADAAGVEEIGDAVGLAMQFAPGDRASLVQIDQRDPVGIARLVGVEQRPHRGEGDCQVVLGTGLGAASAPFHAGYPVFQDPAR